MNEDAFVWLREGCVKKTHLQIAIFIEIESEQKRGFFLIKKGRDCWKGELLHKRKHFQFKSFNSEMKLFSLFCEMFPVLENC